ncbi:MAG TPA: tRNA (adenosine(37)-N6)-threonylcarbamoyltransferase complex ATPase subunit type 1 TsaE [Patescibacteria group bacterium]|nr:tRNA (adenosine(37)-N6)-threonylcarbamoyltransferase complex ATPase subunit type 1 TsaE [Patescibacteria group bacterium]
MEIITKNAEETFRLGEKIGSDLIRLSAGTQTIALSGDLGSGKTVFVQGLAKGLGIKNRIQSPTFILMRRYGSFYHLDLYRLENNVERQVEELGLFDIWKQKNNIVAIEWAEKVKSILPKETIFINFENVNENERKITITE